MSCSAIHTVLEEKEKDKDPIWLKAWSVGQGWDGKQGWAKWRRKCITGLAQELAVIHQFTVICCACSGGSFIWEKHVNFPKRALPCPLTVLVQCGFAKFMVIFPSPCKRSMSSHCISNRRSVYLEHINDVLKFKMFSLHKLRQVHKQQSSGLLWSSTCSHHFLLCSFPHHFWYWTPPDVPKNMPPLNNRTRSKESTNNLTPKPIYLLNIANYRQPGQIHKPCAGDRNVFNYIWSLDCQVASFSVKLSKYGSSLLIIYISEAANAERSYTLD